MWDCYSFPSSEAILHLQRETWVGCYAHKTIHDHVLQNIARRVAATSGARKMSRTSTNGSSLWEQIKYWIEYPHGTELLGTCSTFQGAPQVEHHTHSRYSVTMNFEGNKKPYEETWSYLNFVGLCSCLTRGVSLINSPISPNFAIQSSLRNLTRSIG